MKPVSEPSPLFDKMDALLARHRGSTAGTEEIPVLVDEADDIPVLTEEVNELWPDTEALMFPPEEFMAAPVAPTPVPASAPPAPVPAPAEFLDLPLLDLDALSQANPWGADWEEEIIPPPALPETVPDLPADVLLPELAVADFALDEITPVIESLGVEEIELTAMPAAKVAQIIDFRQIAAKPFAPPVIPEEEILASSGPEAEILPAEAAAANAVLTEDAIAELTATVAAQLGVEIATEVEQLTRQHFASLMHRFYEDSLRQLTAEISQDMESRLQARVAALIKEELKKSGF
ncbi:MAG: hypothetical protein ACRCU9_09195 [Iodobacter sp.]